MQKMIALNVISRPIGAIAKLNTIIKICKYKRLKEGQHFISMTMKVHNALGHDMDCFIRDYAYFFHDK
jgi:hypothetical protein